MDPRNPNSNSRPTSRSQQAPQQSSSSSDHSGRPVPAPLTELSPRRDPPVTTPEGDTPTLRQEILANTTSNASSSAGRASPVGRGSPGPPSVGSNSSPPRADPRPRPGLFQRLTSSSLRSQKNEDVAALPLSMRPSMIEAGRQSSIRIRRRPVSPGSNLPPTSAAAVAAAHDGSLQVPSDGGRRRSSSDPSRGQLPGSTPIRPVKSSAGGMAVLPTLDESQSRNFAPPEGHSGSPDTASEDGERERESNLGSGPNAEFGDEYHQDLVDVLDTIDPEVSTLTTLTNVQNSLFVPDLGRFLSRRPVYNLTPNTSTRQPVRRTPTTTHRPAPRPAPIPEGSEGAESSTGPRKDPRKDPRRPQLTHTSTIDSTLSDSRYAVLPHGRDLSGWTQAEKDELNDHVRHMLHSRRSKFRRGMKGFGQYVRRPLGFLVTLYATLITLFGLAWVLFLIGWINVQGKQLELINIIDYVLVALFAIMGDGLAPFRAWDTYNMFFITHYHRKSWKLRKKKALPKLPNKNDLPELREEEVGIDESKFGDYVVLTDEEHEKLLKHENRFCRSHTFYKPHETETHFAFPIKLLVVIVTLLDCHSLLQISLGAVTWGIDHTKRPFALTTVILCCSITCNVTAGVLIAVGDRRTRKKDVVERMSRQELTAEAIRLVEQKRIEALEEEHGKEEVAAARKSLQMQRAARAETSSSDPVGFIEVEKQASKGSITGKFAGIFGVTRGGAKAAPVDKGQHRTPGTTVMEGGKEVKRSISETGTATDAEILLAEEHQRQKYKREKDAKEKKEKVEKERHEQHKREKEAREKEDREKKGKK